MAEKKRGYQIEIRKDGETILDLSFLPDALRATLAWLMSKAKEVEGKDVKKRIQ
jgi:hypothetical protein